MFLKFQVNSKQYKKIYSFFLLGFVDYRNPRLEQIIAQSIHHSRIDLGEENLIDQDMQIVVKQAIIDKQCAKLNLRNNPITSKGALILASGLKKNSTLEKLHLCDTRIGDLGIQYIVKPLSNNKSILKILNLMDCHIANDGAEHLAVMLKTNKTLIFLDLTNNEIGDEGVAMLSNAIQNHNNTLQYLNLSANEQMTDLSANFLIEMIKYTRTLKALFVWSSNLSKENETIVQKTAQENKRIKISVNNSWIYWKCLRYIF